MRAHDAFGKARRPAGETDCIDVVFVAANERLIAVAGAHVGVRDEVRRGADGNAPLERPRRGDIVSETGRKIC
jgi:hypothetical protein